MNRSYITKFDIKSYETDLNGLFKISSFLNHAQEMANIHAHNLGFGYDNLISSGVVWVLSRFHIIVNRVPAWREEVVMETWHKGSDRLFGFRDFTLKDIRGESLFLATSSWLVIDKESRRIQRIDNVLGNEFPGVNPKDAISEAAPKLAPLESPVVTKKHIVSISDLDINGHTNNVRYFEWALDSLPYSITKGLKIKEIVINFNNESLIGDEIDLMVATCEGWHCVEGKREKNSVFQIRFL